MLDGSPFCIRNEQRFRLILYDSCISLHLTLDVLITRLGIGYACRVVSFHAVWIVIIILNAK